MPPSSSPASHRFFMTSDYSGGKGTVEMAPPPWRKGMLAEFRYPFDVLEQALPQITAQGLHFYFTKNAYQLPEYGNHVVAMLLQEERCKVPVYGRHIRATIRNLMSTPFLGYRPRLRMGRVEAVLTFEYARDTYTHYRSLWAQAHPPSGWPAPIRSQPLTLRIPLGYHSQEDVPYIPMKDRTLDMFFSGQVRHAVPKNDLRYYVSTSKFEVRQQLWDELQKLQAEGQWHLDLGSLASTDHQSQAFDSYSEKMMNSRICLAPRGSIADTFRHFEGLRAGCLVVGNPLPVEPYLHDAPMLVINHWSEIRGILKKYARNDDALQEMGDRGRSWWQQRLTPEVLGRYVAQELNRN